MKKLFTTSFLLILICTQSYAQAFRKGSLVVSLSEGATHSRFTTRDANTNWEVRDGNVDGDRDPITIEYGISDKWGLGINSGADIHHLSPSFYNLQIPAKKMDVITSEITIDLNYHFFVTKKTDLSAFGSVGLSSVYFKGNDGDRPYQYNAGGRIARMGAKAKYYAFRRLGFMGMMSAYSSSCMPDPKKTSAQSKDIATKIKGTALEFGICCRLVR